MALGETKKAKSVKILSISAVPGAITNPVYGLGDDGRVYIWSITQNEWYEYYFEMNNAKKTRANRTKKEA